ILQMIHACPCITDSRIHAREFNDVIKDIFMELSLRQYLLSFDGEALDIPGYHESKRNFKGPAFTVNAYSGATPRNYPEMEHLELYQQLRKLRDQICEKRGVPVYMVAGSQTLQEITSFLPQNLNELAAIKGFGPARLKAHGQQFLEIVVGYCEENGLRSKMAEKLTHPKRSPKKPIEAGIRTWKKETKLESLELFRKGMTAGEIAKERKLAVSTIEGHLTLLIEAGKLHIDELVNSERLLRIQTTIKELGEVSLTQIKESLGNEFGFGEIRWVCAWLKFQKQELVDGPGRE
ncbi:MAG TPA: helix-turn-helix domain-containing protein, partial [Chitinophagaceae bacterium]|nr:helix-turn-helix domain-containing protein [Chitinophagaceae bacterium]